MPSPLDHSGIERRIDTIFRYFLAEEAIRAQNRARVEIGRLLRPAELDNTLRLTERQQVCGLMRSRVRAILQRIDEGQPVEAELMTAPPSIDESIRQFLAERRITDRITYHARMYGYALDMQKAQDRKRARQILEKGGAESFWQHLAALVHLMPEGSFNAPFERRHKIFPPPLVELTLGRKIQSRSNPVDADLNAAGDLLYGPLDRERIRQDLRILLQRNGFESREALMATKVSDLRALFRDNFIIDELTVVFRVFDPRVVSTRGWTHEQIKKDLAALVFGK